MNAKNQIGHKMNIYDFTLVLSGVSLKTEDLEDRLYEANCDDALLCFCGDTPYLEFSRKANDAESAIASALKDLAAGHFEVASIQEVGYVTVSGAAAMANIKKSTFDHYAKGRRGKGFPAPRYGLQTGTPLYYWPAIAQWLSDNKKAPETLAQVAQAAIKLLPDCETLCA